MAKRKFLSEFGLDTWNTMAAIVQQDSLAQLATEPLYQEHPCHIYMIARAPRIAIDVAMGRMENTRPSSTNIGLPGGCGMPSVNAAAMYSLVSHMAVEGASVMRYSSRTAPVTHAAAP